MPTKQKGRKEHDGIGTSPRCFLFTVVLGPDGLKIAAVGNLGECLLTVSSCVSLDCTAPTSEARSYPLPNLVSDMRGLEFAEERCLRITANGMIAIQHQIFDLVGQGAPNLVDFIMTCLQDNEDDNGTQPSSRGLSSQASADPPYSLACDSSTSNGSQCGQRTQPRS